jgi:hypothetical protein
MTAHEDPDAPDVAEEENNDSKLQPEPDLAKKAPTPQTTTVPRIKPT